MQVNFGDPTDTGHVEVCSRWYSPGLQARARSKTMDLEGKQYGQDRDISQDDSKMKIFAKTVTGQMDPVSNWIATSEPTLQKMRLHVDKRLLSNSGPRP